MISFQNALLGFYRVFFEFQKVCFKTFSSS